MKISIKKYALGLAEVLKGEKDEVKRGESVDNFLKLLRKKKQSKLLKRFFPSFKAVWQEISGKIEVNVTVPYEPDSIEKEALEKSLGGIFGKKIILNVKVDQEVIGGMRLEFGEYVLDGTILKNLEVLKSKIAYSNN